jgi:hypothetical protein
LRSAFGAWDASLEAVLIEDLALDEHMGKDLFMLSTGTRRKLGSVAAFACGADLSLIDMPFAALDAPARAVLGELLQEAARRCPSRLDRGRLRAARGRGPVGHLGADRTGRLMPGRSRSVAGRCKGAGARFGREAGSAAWPALGSRPDAVYADPTPTWNVTHRRRN